MHLKQYHQYSLEERHLTHEVRMKVLDVITKFPAEERVEIIGKIVNASATPPADTAIVLNPMQQEKPPVASTAAIDEFASDTKSTKSKALNHHTLPTLALMPIHDSKRVIAAQLHKLAAYRSSATGATSNK